MKNVFGLFFKKGNRKMALAFLLFLIFFIVNLISLSEGIEIRQTWRILTAVAGALACITLCSIIVNALIKASKKVEPAEPVKRRR